MDAPQVIGLMALAAMVGGIGASLLTSAHIAYMQGLREQAARDAERREQERREPMRRGDLDARVDTLIAQAEARDDWRR